MASGQIDEIDLVTPEAAGVNQKKEMQPDDKRVIKMAATQLGWRKNVF